MNGEPKPNWTRTIIIMIVVFCVAFFGTRYLMKNYLNNNQAAPTEASDKTDRQ